MYIVAGKCNSHQRRQQELARRVFCNFFVRATRTAHLPASWLEGRRLFYTRASRVARYFPLERNECDFFRVPHCADFFSFAPMCVRRSIAPVATPAATPSLRFFIGQGCAPARLVFSAGACDRTVPEGWVRDASEKLFGNNPKI